MENCSTFEEAGADSGEVKWVNFHPPPPLSFFSYPSNIDWFYYIITKIQPHFKILDSRLRSISIEKQIQKRDATFATLQ